VGVEGAAWPWWGSGRYDTIVRGREMMEEMEMTVGIGPRNLVTCFPHNNVCVVIMHYLPT